MNKLIVLIIGLLLLTTTMIQAQDQPKKTAVISIQDENGRYVDLSHAEIHLKNNDINIQWNMGSVMGWDIDKTSFSFTSNGVEITTSTDEALNFVLYLDNGESYYISKQLDFYHMDSINLNVKAKELKYVDLNVFDYKNRTIGYNLVIPEFYDRKEGVYVLDTNHTKRFFTNVSTISLIFNSYDAGIYHLYKETIAITKNMTKTVAIPKTDKYKQTITYSSYYSKFSYFNLRLADDPGTWYELQKGPINIYSNVPIAEQCSIWFSSVKGSIYDISRSTMIRNANMQIGNSFKIADIELQMNYDGSKSMNLVIDDEYKNNIRFIDINRNNDYKYGFYTTNGKSVKSGFGSLYWTYLDKEITLGKYMLKVQLNKEIVGSESTRYFLLEIMSDKKWKITDEDGYYKLVENGSWVSQTGKTTKPNFSLISDSKINIINEPSTSSTNTSTDVGATSTTSSTASGKITDIKTTDWFYNDVTFLIEKKVINGFADNTFKPGEQVKVDAFIKMVIAALGYELPKGSYYWAQPYIDKAIDLGIIRSDDFDTYQRSITRGEMANIAAAIMNQIEQPRPYQYYEYQIMDFDTISPILKKPVLIAMSQGIITGYEDYTFRASNPATRAQAATIISRIIDANKRKQINYFEDQKKMLEDKSNSLKTKMENHKKNIDEGIDYLLGYNYDFKPFESKEEIRTLFLQKLNDFEAKLGQQVPIIYGEQKSQVIDIEGNTCEITVTENYFRAKWILSSSMILYYEKNADGRGYFIRDILKNRDYGFNYDALKDELRIDSTLPDSFDGVGYFVYLSEGNYISQIKEFDMESRDKFVVYNGEYISYYDQNENLEVYVYPDQLIQIYLMDDASSGNGIGYVHDLNNYSYIGEVNNFEFDGIGYAIHSDGTVFIGEYEDMILNGKGTMFCTSGLVLEDTFQNYVAYSIQDSNYYPVRSDKPSIENEIDRIILSQIKPSMSTDEKIKAIHDYLVLNITYDTGNVDNSLEYFNINNAYAGIVNKSTICLGYAQSMNLILNRLGIESYVVIGDTDSDKISDHAWNYVKFADGFYHVDVTWDDTDVGNEIYYDYFKVNDSTMRNNRGVEKIMGYGEWK